MKVDTFFQNFELLTDAPNAIAKLREIILQLAVSGKLVPQEPNNEPAYKLLAKIKSEREKLECDSNIRLFTFLNLRLKENNYQLPQGWEWTKLGYVALILMGQSPPGETYNEDGNGVPLINGPVEFRPGPFSETILGKFTTAPSKMCRKGDLLICVRGATTGRTNIAAFDACIGRGVAAIRAFTYQPYINYFVLASRQKFLDLGTGSTFPSISQDKIQNFPIPLPPIAEQKRIVEKCDRLLSICDEIEKRQQQRQESIVRMNESAIAQLLSSQNPDDFRQHWQRICNNFDLLYSIPETIPKLRQAILQLAVQGKLVRQEFDESTLRYLIERITQERLALCPNEKDKQRILSEFAKIIEESTQGKTEEFEIPAICICDFITKGTTPSNNELLPEGEIPYLKVYNIVDNKIDFFYKPTYISRTVHTTKLKRSLVFPGDVLMNIVGPPLGKIAIVPDDFPEWNINQALAVFRPVDSIYNRFVYYALSCYATLEKVLNETKGTAGQDNLSLEQCRSLRIPLYTIETQKRIVEKCDRLMSLCDTLEAKLKQGRDSSEKLMEVAAKQVLTA